MRPLSDGFVTLAYARPLCLLLLTGSIACATTSGGREAASPGETPYDVVIGNGKIVDGTGNAWFYGDVGIRGDRIVAITRRNELAKAAARRRIDATGLVVAPGFIDIQGQSGGAFLNGDGRDVGKLTQGVTTEILGEAYTAAPVSSISLADIPSRDTAGIASAKRFIGEHGFDAWLRAMQSHGISANVGSFVGASTIRRYAMGMHMGAATGAPLDSMRSAMRRAMEDGRHGADPMPQCNENFCHRFESMRFTSAGIANVYPL